jgi:hypothetical protein
MPKTYGDAIDIMRRVIGRSGQDDPDATDGVLLSYLGDFTSLIMGQDIKSHDLYSYFEFNTLAGQDTYPFKGERFTNIFPNVTASGFKMRYHQNPNIFFNYYPETQDWTLQQRRPTDLLFYNDEILLRPVPDDSYLIKMKGYKEIIPPAISNTAIPQDYMLRYIAYGASMDWLADFGEDDLMAKKFPTFTRYRALVTSRTAVQNLTQRPIPAL